MQAFRGAVVGQKKYLFCLKMQKKKVNNEPYSVQGHIVHLSLYQFIHYWVFNVSRKVNILTLYIN